MRDLMLVLFPYVLGGGMVASFWFLWWEMRQARCESDEDSSERMAYGMALRVKYAQMINEKAREELSEKCKEREGAESFKAALHTIRFLLSRGDIVAVKASWEDVVDAVIEGPVFKKMEKGWKTND